MKQFKKPFPKIASAIAIAFAIHSGNALAAGPGKSNPIATNAPLVGNFAFTELLTMTGRSECPIAGMISGIGEATLLGKTILAATDCVSLPTPANPYFNSTNGKFVLTMHTGETLFATFTVKIAATSTPSLYELTDGTFSITGGTGRYTRAYGSGTLTGQETLSVNPFAIPATGTITVKGIITY